jgi:hypothetical protein
MRAREGILLPVLVVAWTAAPVQAEWRVTPYRGMNVAGDVEFRRGGPGGSVGLVGDRLGFEVDFQRYQHFFKDADVAPLVPNQCGAAPRGQSCLDLDTDATGFMGNMVAPIRGQGARWRPYGTAGLGVIHAWVEGSGFHTDQTNLAFNVGGGVVYAGKRRLGLRVDLRYFHALVDESKREGGSFEDYGFLRLTVGATFRFPR